MTVKSTCLALAIACSAIFSREACATNWIADTKESRIGFGGTHAGNAFKGSFGTWEAVVAFDPADLAHSKATVTVSLASAKTGDATYDKTLPTVDWFDVARGPTAVFETSGIRGVSGDSFVADGTLSIRGAQVPVVFTFDFKANGDTAQLTGKTQLKRLAFGIGKGSDDSGAWVSLDIPVDVTVTFKRAP